MVGTGHLRKHRLPAIITTTVLLVSLSLAVVPGLGRAANPDGTIDKIIKGQFQAGSSFYQSSLTAADIDGDGQQEILVGNTNGNLYCFTSDARPRWVVHPGQPIQAAPACKDVNGDGKMEIFVGDMAGRMWGFDCNGRVLSEWGWPKQTENMSGFCGIFSSAAIADVNNDGADEIIVGTYGHFVHVWTYFGVELPGWPFDNKDTIWSSPAVADINHDGYKEIIIGADSTGGNGWPYPAGGLLYAFNYAGAILPNWPKMTPEVTWSSPAVADVNGDGWDEIFVGTGHYYKATHQISTQGQTVYGYTHDGWALPGWPVPAAGSTFSSPAIADIDGDGQREIAIACNQAAGTGEDHIMVYRANGQFMWDIKGFGGPMMGSPALGDITGDGLPDVIIGSGVQMCAWDHNGTLLWSQNLHNYVVTSPVVGDFDNDGNTEVAVATGDAPGGGIPGGDFYVFNMGQRAEEAQGAETSLYPWPMFRRSAEHTGKIMTGNEPPPPPPPANFHEYILLMNRESQAANVTLDLMNEKGETAQKQVVVNPTSRYTIFVNDVMPGCSVSAKVSSDVPVTAERAMYFNYKGTWNGGTDAVGAKAADKSWYFAEGTTRDNFDAYITMQNPNADATVATLDYMIEGEGLKSVGMGLPGGARTTVHVPDQIGGGKDFSVKVTAGLPIVAERPMYFNYQGKWTGGHDVMGINAPAKSFYFAEGATYPNFDEYLCLQNPGEGNITVNATYMLASGQTIDKTYYVPRYQRKTISVNSEVGKNQEVSVALTSDDDFVAERPMYFNYTGKSGVSWTGGHDVIGAVKPSTEFNFAEGYTGPGFDEWLCLQNPNDTAVNVIVTYCPESGQVIQRGHVVGPKSRATVFVNEDAGTGMSLSCKVTSDAPIIAERPMYFSYNGNGQWTGGHDVVGVAGPSKTWYFAEGYTGR